MKKDTFIHDTIVSVKIGDSFSLNWNNYTSKFEEDALWKKIVFKFDSHCPFLVEQIANKSESPAYACANNYHLKIGDFAFLVIDKIKLLPFFELTGIQCDYFELGCPYPVGYFEAIDQKRDTLANRVRRYLSEK